MTHSTPNRGYFDCHRELMEKIASLPDSLRCDREVDSIAQHFLARNVSAALEELYKLRDSFNETVTLLSERIRHDHNRIYKADTENLLLRLRELEHARIVADWQDDREAIARFDQAIAWYNKFFGSPAAIADLDPDIVASP